MEDEFCNCTTPVLLPVSEPEVPDEAYSPSSLNRFAALTCSLFVAADVPIPIFPVVGLILILSIRFPPIEFPK